MKRIAVSQRVIEETRYKETRDALDQRWTDFLHVCGLLPVLVPNHLETAKRLTAEMDFGGILLTGGSQHPRRDPVEDHLLHWGDEKKLPVLGVCHGMQVMQRACGLALAVAPDHVADKQDILIDGKTVSVNSYHDYGTKETAPELYVWAVAQDKIVKAVRHVSKPWLGIMWHPERTAPFAARDIDLFKSHFK